MKITVKNLKALIKESLDDELNTVSVGDLVDVDSNENAYSQVRVLELVPDVNAVAGEPDPRDPKQFTGPGFIADTEDGEQVFSLNQVIPGSKMKGYFPDEDPYDDLSADEPTGRPIKNRYRRMAQRFATGASEKAGSYVSGLPDDIET